MYYRSAHSHRGAAHDADDLARKPLRHANIAAKATDVISLRHHIASSVTHEPLGYVKAAVEARAQQCCEARLHPSAHTVIITVDAARDSQQVRDGTRIQTLLRSE